MDIEEKISDLERQFSELKDAFKQQQDVVELTFRKAAEVWQILCDRQLRLEKLVESYEESIKKNTETSKYNSELIRTATADFEDFRKSMIERIERLETAFEEWRKPVMERLGGLEASVGIGKVSKVSPLS